MLQMPRSVRVVLAVSFLSIGSTFGQSGENVEIDLFRPRLELSASFFPERAFDDHAGEYGSQTGSILANIPVGALHLRPEQGIRGYQHLIQLQASAASPNITFLSQDRRLYTGGLSWTTLLLGRNDNLYILSAGATMAEDGATIHSPSPRFQATGVVADPVGEKTTLIYGGAVTYVFGRGLVLPVFGAHWKLSPKWGLTAMAPFVVVAQYRATEKLGLRLRTGPAGNRYRFSNEGDFPGQPDVLYLQIARWQTTGQLAWTLSPDVTLVFEAGTTRTTRFSISDNQRGSAPLFTDTAKGAPYASLAARFAFGKTLIEKSQAGTSP